MLTAPIATLSAKLWGTGMLLQTLVQRCKDQDPMQIITISNRYSARASTHLTAVTHLPLPVHRRQEAVLGNHKLGMAAVGRRQLYVKGAPLKRGTWVAELQPELGACVAGAVIIDDVVQGNDMGRLNLSHALTPCLCLPNRSQVKPTSMQG